MFVVLFSALTLSKDFYPIWFRSMINPTGRYSWWISNSIWFLMYVARVCLWESMMQSERQSRASIAIGLLANWWNSTAHTLFLKQPKQLPMDIMGHYFCQLSIHELFIVFQFSEKRSLRQSATPPRLKQWCKTFFNLSIITILLKTNSDVLKHFLLI